MKYESDFDPVPTEKEAISAGLALLKGKYTGSSDFDRAMREIQKRLKIKKVVDLPKQFQVKCST